MKSSFVIIAAALAACSHPTPPASPSPAAIAATPAPECAPRDPQLVIKAVVELFAAMKIDDLTAFHAVTTPDFYAFERGVRMAGDELPQMIAGSHAEGKRLEWSVTQPVVQVDCKLAVISYLDVGAIGNAATMQPASWLESAELVYFQGAWRIRFVHSTRT